MTTRKTVRSSYYLSLLRACYTACTFQQKMLINSSIFSRGSPRWSMQQNNYPLRRVWKIQACSAFERMSSRETLLQSPVSRRMLSRKQNQALHSGTWQKDKRQWVYIETRETGARFKGKLLPLEQWIRRTGFPERLCSFHPWRLSRLSWINPWETSSEFLVDPALSRSLDQRPPEASSNLNYPVILWYKFLHTK